MHDEYENRDTEVRFTYSFLMSSFPITQTQYLAVTGKNPSYFTKEVDFCNNPVDQVTWFDAKAFCEKASKATGWYFRLPTDAEWEYACRSGTRTLFYNGSTDESLSKIAWWQNNSGGRTHPVGQKDCNTFGLYDMLGNVLEWCEDWYSDAMPSDPVLADYSGPAQGTERCCRGGHYARGANRCESGFRTSVEPHDTGRSIGFRVVIEKERPPLSAHESDDLLIERFRAGKFDSGNELYFYCIDGLNLYPDIAKDLTLEIFQKICPHATKQSDGKYTIPTGTGASYLFGYDGKLAYVKLSRSNRSTFMAFDKSDPMFIWTQLGFGNFTMRGRDFSGYKKRTLIEGAIGPDGKITELCYLING